MSKARSFRWHRGLAVAGSLAVIGALALAVAPAGAAPTFSSRSPVSASTLMARAVHAGLVTPRAAAGINAAALPNVKASNLGSQPVNEVPITADPSNPSHLLTGGNDY